MGKIETIKQKILQLDAGSFQNLCDSYLCKKFGYQSIVSLGGKAGTQKTTLGTPDTYFITPSEGYILVEYTTQLTGIFEKIRDDIAKCLDKEKIGIPYNKISGIIYCHTSSNITPSQDSKLKKICEKVGINLTIIGIDAIAEDIYLIYHSIARDFLGMPISTGQIQSYDEFIIDYNSNGMAAPTDTEFLFRQKELQDIEEAYNKVDVVILNGSAGNGKTRLALHYLKNYVGSNNKKVYCICSKGLPIYEDLNLFLEKPGDYFLFIDDANQLSGSLEHIIRYVNMKQGGYNVKILITVRDYAIQKVVNTVKKITHYEKVNVNVFSDKEINKLLEVTFEIVNQYYQERILKISEGNPRIAMLAGKLVCDSNHLEAITDVSQLYENYYGDILEDNKFSNRNLCITAGIIAFLGTIYLEKIDIILLILKEKGINREEFIENIYMLHEQEIVDIYNDKVVRFSDQCLSNYLLKYVFFDKKLFSLSKMIKTCFPYYKDKTIFSINTLITIFKNKELFNFIEKEIKLIWNELSTEKSTIFYEFMKVFFPINPIETLLILKDEIENDKSVVFEYNNIDIEKEKNNHYVNNYIIEILGKFAYINDFRTACELFFEYYLKRPDLFMEFYHAVNMYFCIDKNSIDNDFYTQITLFEKIIEYSNDWEKEPIVIFFLQIVKEFLKVHFSPVEGGKNNKLIMYQIPLRMSKGVEKYRKLIWESLISLSKIERYKEKVGKILDSYCNTVHDISIPVVEFDLVYIELILNLNFSTDKLKNCLIVRRIEKVLRRIGVSYGTIFSEYFKGEKFKLYCILEGTNYKVDNYEENKKQKKQAINDYISNCDFEMFKKLIDICSEISGTDNYSFWKIKEGLEIAFDSAFNKKNWYVDAVKYYLKKNTPYNLYPYDIIKKLFLLLSDSQVYKIIVDEKYSQRNFWLYVYYYELPPKLITQNHLNGLYDFLKDTSDKKDTLQSIRGVDFLEKYKVIDEQAFLEGCKIILEKREYSLHVVNNYFELLFNYYHNKPEEVIRKFNSNLKLLEEIYCTTLSYDNNSDHDGKFLKDIYLSKPSILYKYIEYLINKKKAAFKDNYERDQIFLELEDFIEIYNEIFEQMIINCEFPRITVVYFLESLLYNDMDKPELLEKQHEWISQCIKSFSKDKMKMYCLFSAISNLEIKRKEEYILMFLENNTLFEDFQEIPLTSTSYSYFGSAVPIYSAWIEFLETLASKLVGLKWIKHKKFVEEEISFLKVRIESEEINRILRG